MVRESIAGESPLIRKPGAAVGGIRGIQDERRCLQPARAGELRRGERQLAAGKQFAVVTRGGGGIHASGPAALYQTVVYQHRRGHGESLAADNLPARVIGERAARNERRAVIALQPAAVGKPAGGDAKRAALHRTLVVYRACVQRQRAAG
ncbi:hypothetical protein ACKS2F_003621 [Cronobacter dublinensis]